MQSVSYNCMLISLILRPLLLLVLFLLDFDTFNIHIDAIYTSAV